MNTNSIKNRPQIYSAKKPCCKVCKDAGKSENEYSTHYVKDLNGQVTCPTLLNQECRFCSRKGHTTSHCSELAKKKEKESRLHTAKPPLSPPKKEVKKSNVFAYLEINSDESESEDEKDQEFPALAPVSAVQQTSHSSSSYAAMAAKTITEYNTAQKLKIQNTVKSATTWAPLAPGQKKSWSQMNDEDSDEDDEEEQAKEQEYQDNSAW
jgi:hypothetical protein